MAITSCESCGSSSFKRTSTDSTGTVAVCTCGHWTFEDSGTNDDSAFILGDINVRGTFAIGHGAVAINNNSRSRRKRS